jgi:hypothetical protein
LIGLYQGGRIGLTDPEFRELFAASMERLLDGIAR